MLGDEGGKVGRRVAQAFGDDLGLQAAFQARVGDIDDLVGDLHAQRMVVVAMVMAVVMAAIGAVDMPVMVMIVIVVVGHGPCPFVCGAASRLGACYSTSPGALARRSA
jgi:hypothetical protein